MCKNNKEIENPNNASSKDCIRSFYPKIIFFYTSHRCESKMKIHTNTNGYIVPKLNVGRLP